MRKKIIERMPENVAFARKCLFGLSILLMAISVLFMILIASGSVWIPRQFEAIVIIGCLGIGVIMLINYFVSVYFYGAALAKGYDELAFLLLPFFFGIIGCLFVIAMPDRGHRIPEEIVSNVDEQITAEEPEESVKKTPMIKNIIKKNIPRLVILVFLLIVIFAIFRSCGFIQHH